MDALLLVVASMPDVSVCVEPLLEALLTLCCLPPIVPDNRFFELDMLFKYLDCSEKSILSLPLVVLISFFDGSPNLLLHQKIETGGRFSGWEGGEQLPAFPLHALLNILSGS
jgi:hypothetical protein